MGKHQPDHTDSTIHSFNRFELKYLLYAESARAIEADLALHVRPDVHGDGNGDYGLASLYYDSPDRRCYWEKIEGIKFRRKLRLRRYQHGGVFGEDSDVFVEIKQRVDKVTQKRRLILPYNEAQRLASGEDIYERSGFESEQNATSRQEGTREMLSVRDRRLVEEIMVFSREYRLEPACIVTYRRRAFLGGDLDPGLRITFDTDLRARTTDLDLASDSEGRPVLVPGLVVMEIKINDRIPRWLTDIVAARNLRLVRISKYVACLDTRPGSAEARAIIAAGARLEKERSIV